jgi:hypothetical protein
MRWILPTGTAPVHPFAGTKTASISGLPDLSVNENRRAGTLFNIFRKQFYQQKGEEKCVQTMLMK